MAGRTWGVAKLVIGVIFLLVTASAVLNEVGQSASGDSGHTAGLFAGNLITLVLGVFLTISGVRTLRRGKGPPGPQNQA